MLELGRLPERIEGSRTPEAIEDKVIEAKNKTRLGPKGLSIYLAKYEKSTVPSGTIRHILRRNKCRITYGLLSHKRWKEKRGVVDWYSAKPFEIVYELLKAQLPHLDENIRLAVPTSWMGWR